MNTTQQRFEGFLNTPVLWKDSEVYHLTQFKVEQELLSFDQVIDSNQRLGKYVERFVSFQLSRNSAIKIISENIQISKDKITLGELDCILVKNKKPIHLEIVYKFYLYDSSVGNESLHHWIPILFIGEAEDVPHEDFRINVEEHTCRQSCRTIVFRRAS